MQIEMIPTPGAEMVQLRVEAESLTVNGKTYDLADLPTEGPVRLQDGIALVEYGEDGGVSTCSLTDAHSVMVVQPERAPPPPPEVDPDELERATLAAQRAAWVAQRWQMIAVLGADRWQAIQDFATGPLSTWAIKAVIDNAVEIPRNSETVELLAYILGLTDDEVDDMFRRAVSLSA